MPDPAFRASRLFGVSHDGGVPIDTVSFVFSCEVQGRFISADEDSTAKLVSALSSDTVVALAAANAPGALAKVINPATGYVRRKKSRLAPVQEEDEDEKEEVIEEEVAPAANERKGRTRKRKPRVEEEEETVADMKTDASAKERTVVIVDDDDDDGEEVGMVSAGAEKTAVPHEHFEQPSPRKSMARRSRGGTSGRSSYSGATGSPAAKRRGVPDHDPAKAVVSLLGEDCAPVSVSASLSSSTSSLSSLSLLPTTASGRPNGRNVSTRPFQFSPSQTQSAARPRAKATLQSSKAASASRSVLPSVREQHADASTEPLTGVDDATRALILQLQEEDRMAGDSEEAEEEAEPPHALADVAMHADDEEEDFDEELHPVREETTRRTSSSSGSGSGSGGSQAKAVKVISQIAFDDDFE